MQVANTGVLVLESVPEELEYQETEIAPRLKEWAIWVKAGGLHKRQHWSTLDTLIPPPSEPRLVVNHNHAYEIEVIVSRMPARHRDAIRLHYVWHKRYTREQKAKILGVGKSRFYQIVREAELMVKNNLTRVDKRRKNSPQLP